MDRENVTYAVNKLAGVFISKNLDKGRYSIVLCLPDGSRAVFSSPTPADRASFVQDLLATGLVTSVAPDRPDGVPLLVVEDADLYSSVALAFARRRRRPPRRVRGRPACPPRRAVRR